MELYPDSGYMDILYLVGFVHALLTCVRLRAKGLLHAGWQCITFVFMSQGTYGRKAENEWLGNGHRSAVLANEMLRRTCLLFRFCKHRDVGWIGENPKGTRAANISFFQQCIDG